MQFILLHGTGGNPDNFWFPWLAEKLETMGHKVARLQMPDLDRADLSVWTPYAFEHLSFTAETILIGHSAGVPFMLNILQQIDTPIYAAIGVAGWLRQLNGMPDDHQTLLKNPDFAKIKANCPSFTFIHSDNDPWTCDHTQGDYLRQHLGGNLVVMTGEGHFGSATFKQTYPEFPLLLKMIELVLS